MTSPRSTDTTPKGQRGISPTLFYTVLVLIILSIAAFLLLRPTSGNPSGSARTTTQR